MLNVAKGRRRREGQLVEINNAKELEAWLRNQPREVSLALAARAALRVLPILQTAKREGYMGKMVLPMFRAAAVSWAAAKYPAHKEELATACRAAASRAAHPAGPTWVSGFAAAATLAAEYAAVVTVRDTAGADAANAAANALDALAGYAVYSAANASPDEAAYAATNAAPAEAVYAAEIAATATAFWSAVSDDATLVEEGRTASDVAGSLLWPQGQPDRLRSLWQEMKAALHAAKQDWEVWTDWYDDRLAGHVRSDARELAYVRIEEALWKQGPAIVNAEIKRRIAELDTTITHEIEITVLPEFAPERSDPERASFWWAYTVEVANRGQMTMQLIARHLKITDGNGMLEEVRSAGVVGEQPVLKPGDVFRYAAGINMTTPSGIMTGIYRMVNEKGDVFDVQLPVVAFDFPFSTASGGTPSIVVADKLPAPIENVPSAVSFGWTLDGTITIVAGAQNWPVLPFKGSEQDHANRLEACRVMATDTARSLRSGKWNARADYAETLDQYVAYLPKQPEEGNFLLADAKARIIRAMFAAEQDFLPAPFGAELKVLLEQHIGLRAYYPATEDFMSRCDPDIWNARCRSTQSKDLSTAFGTIRRLSSSRMSPAYWRIPPSQSLRSRRLIWKHRNPASCSPRRRQTRSAKSIPRRRGGSRWAAP